MKLLILVFIWYFSVVHLICSLQSIRIRTCVQPSGRLILLMNIKHKPFTCCFILGYASSLKSQPLTKIKEEEIWELTCPKMVLEKLPIFHQHQTNIYQKLYHRTFSFWISRNISLEADFISLRYDHQNSPASSFFVILFSSNTAK